MNSETTPPVLPAAGGSYRLEGASLTRVAEPTRTAVGKPKGARFVGGEKADRPAKAKPPKLRKSEPPAADPATTPAAGEPAASDPS